MESSDSDGRGEVDRLQRQRLLDQRGQFVLRDDGEVHIDLGRKVVLREVHRVDHARRQGAGRRQRRKVGDGRKAPRAAGRGHIGQVRLVLHEVRQPQAARCKTQARQVAPVGAEFAPHHGFVDPHHGVVLQRDHGQRQHVGRHTGRAALGEDGARGAATPRVQRIGAAVVLPGHQHHRGGLDHVTVFHRALAGDRGRVGADGVGGELHRAQRQHEQAGAAAQRRLRQARQTEARRELLGHRQVGQLHVDVARQQHEFARGRHTVPAGDHQRLGLAAFLHKQARGHAAARGLAQVGLARQKILLVADQVARGEKAAVEVAWPAAPVVFDQHARVAQGLHLAGGDRLAGGAGVRGSWRAPVKG